MSTETPEQRGERLAPTAAEWAARLRHENVDALATELLDPLPRLDLYALIGLLGGAVDTSQQPSVLWGWVRYAQALAAAKLVSQAGDEPVGQVDEDGDTPTWADVPVDEMTTSELDAYMRHLREVYGMEYTEIGDRVGVDPCMVSRRLRRIPRPRSACGATMAVAGG